MSYYRYITSVYKSYLPELNRTLRSSSVPRTVTSMDYCELLPGGGVSSDLIDFQVFPQFPPLTTEE